MLRQRLEVVSSENVLDLCNQATRIATHLGIEVVFDLNGKDVVAKPGMSGDSLASECEAAPAEEKGRKPEKEKAGKGGKGKSKPNEAADENTTTATAPAPETEMQKESL